MMRKPFAAPLVLLLGCGSADVAWDGGVRDSAGVRTIVLGPASTCSDIARPAADRAVG